MDKERLEQEIECMLKYVNNLDDAKDLLAHKERLLARVLDDNKWLERDYYEIEEENASLKNELVKECKAHQEAMQIADKRIKELETQLREKDARIEELEGQFAYECECNKQFVECQRENERLKAELKTLIKNEKVFSREFAIKQLKEIKKLFEEKYSYDVKESDLAIIYELDIDKIIDNQINKLKGDEVK